MKINKCEECSNFNKSHFCDLSHSALQMFNASKCTVKVKKNDYLFREGDTPEGLYCVGSGLFKIIHTNENGQEVFVRMEAPGSILGYRALFSNDNYTASAVAHENSEACFIPKKDLNAIIEKDPKLALRFLQQISNELHKAEERIIEVVNSPASERIAKTLLLFKKILPQSKWTRKDIADWAGTTPETVIRTLAKFEEEGLIKQESRHIHITNVQSLCETANIHQ